MRVHNVRPIFPSLCGSHLGTTGEGDRECGKIENCHNTLAVMIMPGNIDARARSYRVISGKFLC